MASGAGTYTTVEGTGRPHELMKSGVSVLPVPSPTHVQSPFEALSLVLRSFVRRDAISDALLGCGLWDDVLRLATSFGVGAPVVSYLQDYALAEELAPYAQFLTEYPRRVRAKNKFLGQELGRIERGLAEQEVRSLAFKGPVLAAYAYGSLDRRTCADIDLLISPSAFEEARAWLEAEGYRYSSSVKGRTGEKARQFFDRQHSFTRGRSVFHIDLHTGIMPPLSSYAPDFDSLWQRRHAVSMEDYEAQALAPGDMLLALCHQGIKDRWARLKHVLDVAMAAQPVNGHWDEVLQRATDANSRRVLLLGLYMAHEVLDAPLPPPVVATIASDWRVQRVGAWAVEKLPRRREEPDDSLRERIALHGLIQDSPLGSAQYAFYAALRKVWYYAEQVWPTPSS